MRILPFLIILPILCSYASIPEDLYVIPVRKEVRIYGNRIRGLNEDALFKVNLNSRLRVLDMKDDLYKIEDEHGRIGWVEKRFVAPIKKSLLHGFDPASVDGYNDVRDVIIILDGTESDNIIIKPERSFIENLKEHIDRETVERIARH